MTEASSYYSLRRRLLLWIGGPILMASLLSLLIGFVFSWHEIEEVYDAQMAHSAKLLLQIAEYELVEREDGRLDLGAENAALRHKYESNMTFRIWQGDRLVTRSWSAAGFTGIEATPGFSDMTIDDVKWRFFVFVNDADNIRVEVAQRYSIRYELIGQLMSSLIAPALVFIPLIFLIIWSGIRKALKPVVKVSADVDRRNSDDLSPISATALPQEVAPLILALNRLFGRIEGSFRREREFTDHAAHELRTPLAAMKTQTQVLLKKSAAGTEFAEGLQNLGASINRATHLVEQLLSFARLQNEDLPRDPMSLSDCLTDTIAEMRVRALPKNITLSADVAEDIHIKGHADFIAILLTNLLDNAVKYTPPGGHIAVTLSPAGVLDIADDGPGLSDADKARVFERFTRADKTGQSGSGLGLSIARWIAQAHGVTITLHDNMPRGLIARMEWTCEAD